MNTLNIADNIVRLRHNKKITQEQLADFIGVTKASVSKWENRQSTPDITILPQLAAFFDVTIDKLIGYEPQLSKEQIQCLYQRFGKDFVERPFEGNEITFLKKDGTEYAENDGTPFRKSNSCLTFGKIRTDTWGSSSAQ